MVDEYESEFVKVLEHIRTNYKRLYLYLNQGNSTNYIEIHIYNNQL